MIDMVRWVCYAERLFARDWLTVFSGVTAYSLHPGIVRSGLQNHDTTAVGTVVRVAMKLAARGTALEGALNSLFCATSPIAPTKGQGKFFLPVGKLGSAAEKWTNDNKTNAELWQQSECQSARLG